MPTTLEIPDDIHGLDLAVQEQNALSAVRKRLRIGDGALARLVGLSDSGVRTMNRRLKASGLVREIYIDGKAYLTTQIVDKANTSNHCGLLERRLSTFRCL